MRDLTELINSRTTSHEVFMKIGVDVRQLSAVIGNGSLHAEICQALSKIRRVFPLSLQSGSASL